MAHTQLYQDLKELNTASAEVEQITSSLLIGFEIDVQTFATAKDGHSKCCDDFKKVQVERDRLASSVEILQRQLDAAILEPSKGTFRFLWRSWLIALRVKQSKHRELMMRSLQLMRTAWVEAERAQINTTCHYLMHRIKETSKEKLDSLHKKIESMPETMQVGNIIGEAPTSSNKGEETKSNDKGEEILSTIHVTPLKKKGINQEAMNQEVITFDNLIDAIPYLQ